MLITVTVRVPWILVPFERHTYSVSFSQELFLKGEHTQTCCFVSESQRNPGCGVCMSPPLPNTISTKYAITYSVQTELQSAGGLERQRFSARLLVKLHKCHMQSLN